MISEKCSGWLSTVSAALAIVAFCSLVLAAIASYPGPFSPLTNYLSDLGSSKLNPPGAIFFNVACGITGALTALFFSGLEKWRLDGKTKLTAAKAIGIFSGFALILVGLFSEDYGIIHTIVSAVFFVSLTLAIVVTARGLWNHRAYIRPISYYGILIGFFSLLYLASYVSGHVLIIVEWITVVGALGWMGLLAYNMIRL